MRDLPSTDPEQPLTLSVTFAVIDEAALRDHAYFATFDGPFGSVPTAWVGPGSADDAPGLMAEQRSSTPSSALNVLLWNLLWANGASPIPGAELRAISSSSS